MKKIMIALAAVALATASQAATVLWNSGALKDGTGASVTAAGKITGYLYNLVAADFNAYAAMDAATLSSTVGAAFKANELGAAEATKANAYTSRGGATVSLQGTTQFSAGDTAYALLLYVDSANDMYLANVASATFASAQNVTISNLANANKGTAGGSTSWASAPVPEPTSGLLMLLGVAGLALKRKRA